MYTGPHTAILLPGRRNARLDDDCTGAMAARCVASLRHGAQAFKRAPVFLRSETLQCIEISWRPAKIINASTGVWHSSAARPNDTLFSR